MRLSVTLLSGLPYRYRGKYRKIPKITIEDLHKLRHNYEREEQNMLLLRFPYLSVEQSHGHMNDLKPQIYAEIRKKWIEARLTKFSKEITIAERLDHLKHTDPWD